MAAYLPGNQKIWGGLSVFIDYFSNAVTSQNPSSETFSRQKT